jgi:hypothetical protein
MAVPKLDHPAIDIASFLIPNTGGDWLHHVVVKTTLRGVPVEYRHKHGFAKKADAEALAAKVAAKGTIKAKYWTWTRS